MKKVYNYVSILDNQVEKPKRQLILAINELNLWDSHFIYESNNFMFYNFFFEDIKNIHVSELLYVFPSALSLDSFRAHLTRCPITKLIHLIESGIETTE